MLPFREAAGVGGGLGFDSRSLPALPSPDPSRKPEGNAYFSTDRPA